MTTAMMPKMTTMSMVRGYRMSHGIRPCFMTVSHFNFFQLRATSPMQKL